MVTRTLTDWNPNRALARTRPVVCNDAITLPTVLLARSILWNAWSGGS